jgi:peroxiredoxin
MSTLEPGALAPDFVLNDLDGNSQGLDAALSPLTLAIFFKTSCPICHYSWKFYERLHRAYGNAGLRILAISQHNAERTSNFRAEHSATFPHLLDDGFTVSRAYDPNLVPTGFVIDSKGKIVETFESWNSAYLNELSGRIAAQLRVKPTEIVLPQDNAAATKIG